MHDIFDKDILKIMNKNAGDVIQSIIRGGKPVLNQVKAAVGNDGINVLRQGFFKEMLESATEKGVLNPKVLSRRLRTMGNETLDTFLEPNQRKLLDGIIKKSEYIQTKMANKEGRFKTWDFLETIAGTNNDRVTNAIVQPENLGLIKIAKNILSKDRINEIQSTVIGNKIFSVSGTGNYLPVSSTKNFLRYRSVLKELMDPTSFNELSDFVSLGQHMNRIEALAKNVSQTGQVLLGSQTGSAILSSLAQPLKVAQLTLLPWMLGKIYASPQAAKYFTSAAKLPSWSPYAAKSFIQALTIAGITEEPKVEEKPAKSEPKISDKGAFPSVGP
jgi:hypothetical protein